MMRTSSQQASANPEGRMRMRPPALPELLRSTLLLIYEHPHLTFWPPDEKLQTITKCQQSASVPSSDSAAKLVPTPTGRLMAFPEAQRIPGPASLRGGGGGWGVCLCGTVEVIISSGRRDTAFSRPRRGLPVGQLQLHPPPLAPRGRLDSYSLVNFAPSTSCSAWPSG